MFKKIGIIFGGFFLLVGVLNIINTHKLYTFLSCGLLLFSCIYFSSTIKECVGKYIQVGTTFLLSFITIPLSDVNSLVPLLSFILAILLLQKYFIAQKLYLILYFVFFCIITYFCGWNIISITNSILLYIATTTILYIIHNDKT